MVSGPVFGLRAALILLVLIAVIPVFVVVIQSSVSEQKNRIERASANMQALANLGAAHQEQLIEGARQMLVAISRSPAVYGDNPAECSAYFSGLQQFYPAYTSFGLLDAQGNRLCEQASGRPVVNSGDRYFFRQAVASGDFTVGEYLVGRVSGKSAMAFSLPVKRPDGSLRGVLFAALDLRQADGQLDRMTMPPDSSLLVTDASGIVLASAGTVPGAIGQKLGDSPVLRAVMAGQPSVWQSSEMGTRQFIHALQPVRQSGPQGIFVTAMIASDDVLAGTNQRLQWQLGALAVIALASAMTAWVFGDRVLAQPIRGLLRKVQAMQRGHLAPGTEPQSGLRELSQLHRSFEDMAQSLANRSVQRDRALSELATQKKLLESILDSLGEGVMVADTQGHYIHLNAAALRILPGLVQMDSEAEPMTVSTLEYGLLHLDGRTPMQPEERPPARALAGENVENVRYVINGILTGGVAKIIQASARPLRDGLGRIVGSVTAVADVTAEHLAGQRVQEAHEQANEALERRVADRTRELALANKELESFSYSVSHDLRSPLHVIDGFGRALMTAHGHKLDAKGQHYLERIQSSTRQMGHLIDDLLSLAKVSRAEIRREAVDIGSKAWLLVDQLRSRHPGREVHVEVEDGLLVIGDARLLMVVLHNLIENAWKFTARAAHAEIRVGRTTLEDGEDAWFVKDNGAGFDMAYAGKLFEAFQRLHGVDEFEGTGIGLATVQRVIMRHGGRIWAESRPGEGATFWFTLGRAGEGEREDPPAEPGSRGHG